MDRYLLRAEAAPQMAEVDINRPVTARPVQAVTGPHPRHRHLPGPLCLLSAAITWPAQGLNSSVPHRGLLPARFRVECAHGLKGGLDRGRRTNGGTCPTI